MGFKLIASFVLLPFIVGQVMATFTITSREIQNVRVALDGFPHDSIQAGAFPGQLIIANKGDVLYLNVTNKLKNVNPAMRRFTSIHWHGILQDRTAIEDAPSFVNQCQPRLSIPSFVSLVCYNRSDCSGTLLLLVDLPVKLCSKRNPRIQLSVARSDGNLVRHIHHYIVRVRLGSAATFQLGISMTLTLNYLCSGHAFDVVKSTSGTRVRTLSIGLP
ncbi:hypothetical protein C8R44DRAFT_244405 [Mycena epipterygia]|nr:hypothetical protein C8R44DRAFT_244405 [Mycena epipterygia]